MKKGFTIFGLLIALATFVLVALFVFSLWRGIPKPDVSYNIERSLEQLPNSQDNAAKSFFVESGELSNQKGYYFCIKTKSGNKVKVVGVPFWKTNFIYDGQNKVVFIKEPITAAAYREDVIDEGYLDGIKEVEFHLPSKDSILETFESNLSSSS